MPAVQPRDVLMEQEAAVQLGGQLTSDTTGTTRGSTGADHAGRRGLPSRQQAQRASPPADLEALSGRSTLVRERRYRRLLASADVAASALAILVTFGMPGSGTAGWTPLLLLPCVVLGAKLLGLYDRDELVVHKTTLDDVPRLAVLAVAAVLAAWLLDGGLAHISGVTLGLMLFGGTVIGRRAARELADRVTEPERCLLIGSAAVEDRLARVLDDGTSSVLVRRLSIADAHAAVQTGADAVALRGILARDDIQRVIVQSDSQGTDAATLDVVRAAKAYGLRVSVLPSVLDVIGTAVAIEEVGGVTLLGLHQFGLSRSSRLIKRTFDVAVGGTALLVLAPFLAAAAIAIKLDSRGPVFFRQARIGRAGSTFTIMKLRTMSVDAEHRKAELECRNEASDGLFKIVDDPRITRVGGFLRRTSLDELPQLLNVLRGEMSLVGPRPLIPSEDARIESWDRRRLSLAPGMTGPWQIEGSARVPLAEMVWFDYRYAATWSLWTDVKILVRTAPYMISSRGM